MGNWAIIRALIQIEITPKAFANFSPRLELATTLGTHETKTNSLFSVKTQG
jgi:hypothetical protein